MIIKREKRQSVEANVKKQKSVSLVRRVLSMVIYSITLAIVLITIITLAVSSSVTRSIIKESSDASMRFISLEFGNMTDDMVSTAQSIVSNETLKTSMAWGKNDAALFALHNVIIPNGQSAVLFDSQGKVIGSTLETTPNLINDLYVVQQALNGTSAQAITTSSFLPYIIGAAEPFISGEKVVGGVLVVYDLSDNSFVDRLKDKMGQDYTVYCGNTRLSTTITNNQGDRITGTTMSDKVAQEVLTDGQIFSVETRIERNRYIAKYAPIPGPDGTPTGALFAGYNMEPYYAAKFTNILVNIAIGTLMLVLMILNSNRILKRFLKKPLERVVSVIEDIAAGRITEDTKKALDGFNTQDEIGVLAQSMKRAVISVQKIADDTEFLAEALESKDLTVSVETDVHQGIYKAIADVVNRLFGEIVTNMRTVRGTSAQIYSHAEQVSDAAQSLAQGATEQAAAVEELASTVGTISTKVDENASIAREASDASQAAQDQVRSSSEQMEALMGAMAEITDTSKQIDQIIKTIDDIAFQTNILALNAAVEAARAGTAGKGFAVVADEVRNLASKSAEAAKNTAELIESTMAAIQKGTSFASQAEAGLDTVVEKTAQVNELIQQIATAAAEQAGSLSQVNEGIDQIANVVQSNSGIAEQTAASSNHMKEQTEQLNDMVNSYRFQADE